MKPYINPLRGSFLLPSLWYVYSFLYRCNIPCLLRRLAKRVGFKWLERRLSWEDGDEVHLSLGFLEGYQLLWVVMASVFFFVFGFSGWPILLPVIWRLFEIAVATEHVLFAEAQETHDGRERGIIYVKHPSRWIAMSAIQVLEILVGFAILRLHFGPHSLGRAKALYQSFCTMVLNPITNDGVPDASPVWLDTVQLLYCLMFFLVILPVAVNSIRVEPWNKKAENA